MSGFGIDRRARSKKPKGGLRALLGKAPDAQEVGQRLARIARRMLKGAVLDASARRVTLSFHPVGAPVRIVVLPDGDLEITGDTGSIGPAYHDHVIASLTPVLDELEYVWDGEHAASRPAMTTWLAEQLRSGQTRVGLPSEREFLIDAAVQTAMGPRDAAWRDAVIADPMRGADAFAWWHDAPGHEARSRALLAMWLEVPWREPLDRQERTLMETVHADLRAAWRADRALELPWAEWAQLIECIGADDKRADEVRARAVGGAPTIGYRRHKLRVELAGGWWVDLHGSFVGAWEEDDERYWATDGDRVIELSSLTVADEQSSERLLEVAPEKHPVVARVADDLRRGRAEAYDEGDVHIIHGLMAQAPHVAILTCKTTLTDTTWALEMFQSLRQR